MLLAEVIVARVPSRLLSFFVRHRELLKFLTVGAITLIVTTVLFFGLKWTVLPHNPVTANIVATLVATMLSYVLNREWSFSERGGRLRRHEASLFFLVAGVGLGISQVPLWVSSYVFNLRAPHVSVVTENIADFVSATIIGTLLATAFRWWAMRRWVFPGDMTGTDAPVASEGLSPTPVDAFDS